MSTVPLVLFRLLAVDRCKLIQLASCVEVIMAQNAYSTCSTTVQCYWLHVLFINPCKSASECQVTVNTDSTIIVCKGVHDCTVAVGSRQLLTASASLDPEDSPVRQKAVYPLMSTIWGVYPFSVHCPQNHKTLESFSTPCFLSLYCNPTSPEQRRVLYISSEHCYTVLTNCVAI